MNPTGNNADIVQSLDAIRNAIVGPTPVNFSLIARETTAVSGDTLAVSFSAYTYLYFIAYMSADGLINAKMQFNGDNGANYAYRVSRNGAADGTSGSNTSLGLIITAAQERIMITGTIYNALARDKQAQIYTTTDGGGTAATPPTRNELVCKWANTTSQITSINIFNDGAGSYFGNSELLVFGYN